MEFSVAHCPLGQFDDDILDFDFGLSLFLVTLHIYSFYKKELISITCATVSAVSVLIAGHRKMLIFTFMNWVWLHRVFNSSLINIY